MAVGKGRNGQRPFDYNTPDCGLPTKPHTSFIFFFCLSLLLDSMYFARLGGFTQVGLSAHLST